MPENPTDPISQDFLGKPEPHENKSYYSTLGLVCDIDLSLIDAAQDTPESVVKKVRVFNLFVLDLAKQEGIDIYVFLLTQKSKDAFFNEETRGLYGPLLKLNSAVKQRSVALSLVLAEFGTISLTRTDGHWQDSLNFDAFGSDYAILDEFKTWLHQNHYIAENGEANPDYPYRLESGNKSYLALQMPDGQPMPEEDKAKLKTEITAKLETGQKFSILEFFVFSTEKADFDCIPKRLQALTKEIGIAQIIKHMHNKNLRWFDREHLCLIDDKVQAAGLAAKNILECGGLAVAPANADKELKKILIEVGLGGRVSQYRVFLGVIEGIYRAVTGKELSKAKLTKLAQQLT